MTNNRSHENISGIRTKDGKLDITTKLIAKHFQDYYTALCNLPKPQKPGTIHGTRPQIIQNYLRESNLLTLKEDDINQLEKPLEAIELQNAIKDLKKGKSPGPDGFTAIYYKTFQNTLLGPLLRALNSMSKSKETPPTFLATHITVLPKPSKDPAYCASYRPISLLNLDMKLM